MKNFTYRRLNIFHSYILGLGYRLWGLGQIRVGGFSQVKLCYVRLRLQPQSNITQLNLTPTNHMNCLFKYIMTPSKTILQRKKPLLFPIQHDDLIKPLKSSNAMANASKRSQTLNFVHRQGKNIQFFHIHHFHGRI